MGKYRRENRTSKWSYFIEFVIIIAGILVSFYLNEWRKENRLLEKKEILLKEINQDLKGDSLFLEIGVQFYEAMLASHDSLLLHIDGRFQEDSLHNYIDHTISYFPFKENQNTYFKIVNTQELTLEKEDTLLSRFLLLHNVIYPQLHEWLTVEKTFVLQQLLPFMDQNSPFIYPTPKGKSFDGSVFYTLKKKDAYLNMLKSGRLYGQSMLQVSAATLTQIKKLNASIDKELKRLKNKK